MFLMMSFIGNSLQQPRAEKEGARARSKLVKQLEDNARQNITSNAGISS